jgi:hypothetical protein
MIRALPHTPVACATTDTAAITTNRAWKDAGKPKQGPIFDKRQSCRLLYRKEIRARQKSELESYTNELHEALLAKNGAAFWKSWNAKLAPKNKCSEVDGSVVDDVITQKFMQHFKQSYTPISQDISNTRKSEFNQLRQTYTGEPWTDDFLFDTNLVCTIVDDLQRGKAAGLDSISAEHLQFGHIILSCVLAKLFNLMLLVSHVPRDFGLSYTVPLPKIKDCRTKAMTCDDFRGIAISCVLSKVFEHGILKRFNRFLGSDDNQFGFKKGRSCNHAIATLHNVVDEINKAGYTANLCSIDLSKAFDKVDHNALLIKLMQRLIPVKLLDLLANWLSNCFSCIKWNNSFSEFLTLLLQVYFYIR